MRIQCRSTVQRKIFLEKEYDLLLHTDLVLLVTSLFQKFPSRLLIFEKERKGNFLASAVAHCHKNNRYLPHIQGSSARLKLHLDIYPERR